MDHANAQARLLEDGFVHFKGLLSAEDMDDLRLTSEAVLYRTLAAHRERYKSNGSLCNLAELPEYAGLLADERILGAIRSVGGEDIRWTSGYLISKPAGGAPLFWHQDWWGWNAPVSYEVMPVQLFVMIYLTATRVENGCLRVIPGSHLRDHPLHHLPTAHTKEIATQIDETSPTYASHPDELAVAVSPGDVIIGDSRLLHSAYKNSTTEERPLLTLWYIPNFSAQPDAVKAGLMDIYHRKVVDIDEEVTDLPTPNGWPAYALEKVNALLPDYQGDAESLPWNRTPDTTKMLSVR